MIHEAEGHKMALWIQQDRCRSVAVESAADHGLRNKSRSVGAINRYLIRF